jgi:lipopolysaccharide/colanic/teichoic acid biosynthesis glycosyltransferase
MKRLLDLVFSLLGLLLLWPLFILLAVVIKGFDEGPVLFVQERTGRGGKAFRMLKFRTMQLVQAQSSELTVGADARITPPGKWLRRLKFDELPQLLNVLKGEMSLVGPRPEVPKYTALYSEEQRQVLRLKPGITDPASFAFFDESSLLSRYADPERFYREQLMGEKIRINLAYAAKANSWTDVVLILATIGRAVGLHVDLFHWLKISPPQIKT